MRRLPMLCAIGVLILALSAANAGIFACQINCAANATAPQAGGAGTCGGHSHMPGHEKGCHQHASHTHSRIIATAHSDFHPASLQKSALIPLASSAAGGLARAGTEQDIETGPAKNTLSISSTPVLRI